MRLVLHALLPLSALTPSLLRRSNLLSLMRWNHCHHYDLRYLHIHYHHNPQYYDHLQEEAWLYTAKMAGYAISIVLLVVYVLTIQVTGPTFTCSQFRSKKCKKICILTIEQHTNASNYLNDRCPPTSGSSSIYSGGIPHRQHYKNHFHRGHDQHPHHHDHPQHDLEWTLHWPCFLARTRSAHFALLGSNDYLSLTRN